MDNTANNAGGGMVGKKFNLEKLKVKLLSAYYGHPARDLKLICITGATGKVATAHFVHEILKAADQPAAILASEGEIKAGVLHKFLNDAWKAKVQYAVITAPAENLEKDTFYGLPIFAAIVTETGNGAYVDGMSKLFTMKPEIAVLNTDDSRYPDFSQYRGLTETITYGASSDAELRIDYSKLYRKGVEASLAIGNRTYTVASFLTGETAITAMAAAAAMMTVLNTSSSVIQDGIANYEPEQQG